MSPNKQYTKIFGQDGYMEIGEFSDFQDTYEFPDLGLSIYYGHFQAEIQK